MYNLERVRNKLLEKHKSVYVTTIGDDVYMYKLLTKLEYELMSAQVDDDLELQDAIVASCILYPEDLDIDEMYNSDIATLAQTIVAESCVMPQDRLLMLEMFSKEMEQLDNVMCCIILRAFPAYKLEDIESMEYPEFYRLYTRAEWYVLNILEDPLVFSPAESIKNALGQRESAYSDYYANEHDVDENGNPVHPAEDKQEKQQEGKYMGRNLSEVMNEINNSESKRKPMTEEQKAELEKFKQQFPDIEMDKDAMYTGELLSQKAGVLTREATRRKY